MNYGRQLFLLLCVFQRKNRFVSSSSNTQLSLVESHILGEVHATPGLLVGELVDCLNIDASSISRNLASLKKSRFISVKQNPKDRRQRSLFLTKKGKGAFNKLEANANSLLRNFSQPLSRADVRTMASLLTKVADRLLAPYSAARKEHPLRSGFRRLARSLSVIGSNQLGSGISSTQWQVLFSIADEAGYATPSSVEKRLLIEQSRLSHMLTHLKNAGLISRNLSKGDKRVSYLSLTQKGNKKLEGVINRGGALLNRGLNGLSQKQCQYLIKYMQTLLYGGLNDSYVIESGKPVRTAATKKEIASARRLLVSELVRKNKHSDLPETILSSRNTIYALYHNEACVALAELSREKKTLILEQLCATEGMQNSWEYTAFVRLALWRAVETYKQTEYIIILPDTKYILPHIPVPVFRAKKQKIKKSSLMKKLGF